VRDTLTLGALRRLLLTALAAACLGPAAAAPELWELEWTEVETDHFTLATSLPQADAVRLAEELENFRTVVQLFLKIGAFDERIPTKIYVLPGLLPEFGLGDRRAGYFDATVRENYAVMASLGNDSMTVLKHEYVHFLVGNFNSQLYPTWLNEGLADLLSTLTVRNGVLEYGRWYGVAELDPFRRSTWLRYESILERRETGSLSDSDLAKFYAQSSLLTKYLAVGRDSSRALPSQVEQYLSRVEAGESDTAAFEAAFDVRVDQLATKLLGYARGQVPYYTARLGQPLPAVTVTARSMPRDRVAAELGIVLLRGPNPETGIHYCERALEFNPENSLALICTGGGFMVAERLDEAEVVYRRATEVDPANPARELDYGSYFLMRALFEQDAGATDERVAALLAEARLRFTHVHDMNPDNAEALFLDGVAHMTADDDAQAVASLEAAHALLPGDFETQVALAQAYTEVGEPERARRILLRLLAWSHPTDAARIHDMLASIDSAAPAPEVD
jgi:tetratricopeptide (TPR) repeat protein